MRMRYWSSDVCSSDLPASGASSVSPAIAQASATVASRLSSRRSAVLALPLRWPKYTVTPMPRSRVDSTVSTLPIRTPTLRPTSSEHDTSAWENGRATSRERGCRDVEISVVAVSLQQKKHLQEQTTTQIHCTLLDNKQK